MEKEEGTGERDEGSTGEREIKKMGDDFLELAVKKREQENEAGCRGFCKRTG